MSRHHRYVAAIAGTVLITGALSGCAGDDRIVIHEEGTVAAVSIDGVAASIGGFAAMCYLDSGKIVIVPGPDAANPNEIEYVIAYFDEQRTPTEFDLKFGDSTSQWLADDGTAAPAFVFDGTDFTLAGAVADASGKITQVVAIGSCPEPIVTATPSN
ncbi:hypothetical protein EG850_03445 [Gulosibacter macacae]|uniref:Lipoprotein n=1 Tax=Gulosibacter macacae TaxID=2488791 RepID=A0A3P3W0Q3_9MICO|nr:hypothetical protein [Gulosibacter macacae]RRJ87918.1 hypothetical protein EG850_03445 [Gulosibacter macacae]